ncbi:MAG: hypothetical protein RBT63_05930 [Bdellovibrionales bacterium]|nr:hypothetical protein [Bdellovibrionales bacterium]
MPHGVRRPLPILLSFLALALLCFAAVVPGLFLIFEDSEIWGITSSRRLIDNPFTGSSAHFKPLFSALFGSIVAFAQTDWSALIASRWLAIAFGAGGLFSMYALGIVFTSQDKNDHSIIGQKAIFTVLFLGIICTSPILLLHYSKARSDVISTNTVLIAGLLLMLLDHRTVHLRGLIYVLGSTCALLITPKSIDLTAALGLLFLATERERKFNHYGGQPVKTSFLVQSLWFIGPAAALLTIGLIISREFIIHSIVYWIESYGEESFFSHANWVGVLNTVSASPVATGLIMVGLTVGALRFRSLAPKEKGLVLAGLLVLAFILIHSQKYLFFLSSRLPFLALGALPGLHIVSSSIAQSFGNRVWITTVGFILIFVTSAGFSIQRVSRHQDFFISTQKTVYFELSRFLDATDTNRYWDAIGLFPKRNALFHYPSPGDQTNERILEYVEHHKPTVVLRTGKMNLLEPGLMMWFNKHYIPRTDSVRVRRADLIRTEGCMYPSSLLTQIATSENLTPPLALFKKDTNDSTWVRASFHTTAGYDTAEFDPQQSKNADFILSDCQDTRLQLALTEAKPWAFVPPEFSVFFKYNSFF